MDRPTPDARSDERVLGIVGGTGPESTVDYYRTLIAAWRRRRPDGSYPRVIINSVEAGRLFANLASADFDAVVQQLGPAVAALEAAGCERALLASNASHLAFERIRPEPRIPLTAVVAAMRDRDQIDAVVLGGTELALILTEPTCAGVPVLNTAHIHVEAAVDWLLGGP
jgi:aspartate/glutamate racemase